MGGTSFDLKYFKGLATIRFMWVLLGIVTIVEAWRRNCLRWSDHMEWREESNWVKRCMNLCVKGKRAIGRPRKTWQEGVRKDLRDKASPDERRCEKLSVFKGSRQLTHSCMGNNCKTKMMMMMSDWAIQWVSFFYSIFFFMFSLSGGVCLVPPLLVPVPWTYVTPILSLLGLQYFYSTPKYTIHSTLCV